MNFVGIYISGNYYVAPTPIEVTVGANLTAIQDYLNSLNLGVFVAEIISGQLQISSIQNPNTLTYFVLDTPDQTVTFTQSSCVDIDDDPDYYCDYSLSVASDPSDVFVGIVIDLVTYTPPAPIAASDVAAVQAYLLSIGYPEVVYNNSGNIYIIASLVPFNLSYITILRNGSETLIFPFAEANCRIPVVGCRDPLADNYNALAEISDNSCVYGTLKYGCTDITALNYNPDAEVLDDSCIYEQPLTTLQKLKCCVGTMAAKIAIARNLGMKVECCAKKKLRFVNWVIYILEHYHPDAENYEYVTIPGTSGTVVFTYDGVVNFSTAVGNCGGAWLVNGIQIAALPDTVYATLGDFLIALAAEINANDNGYTATVDVDAQTFTVTQNTPDESILTSAIQILKGDTIVADDEESFTGAVNDSQEYQRVRTDNNCLTVDEVTALTNEALEYCVTCCGDHDKAAVRDVV